MRLHVQRDVFFDMGCLQQRAVSAPEPLTRMLAAVRCVLGLVCDVARPGSNPGDTPVMLLGNHYLSQRELGGCMSGECLDLYTRVISGSPL